MRFGLIKQGNVKRTKRAKYKLFTVNTCHMLNDSITGETVMEWSEVIKLVGLVLWPAGIIWIYMLMKKERNKGEK